MKDIYIVKFSKTKAARLPADSKQDAINQVLDRADELGIQSSFGIVARLAVEVAA